MRSCLEQAHGNPSSQHAAGREALGILDEARDTVAAAFGAAGPDICFTASGTEAANLAVLGRALSGSGGGIVFSAIEHDCVLKAVEFARELGCQATPIPVDGSGVIDPGDLEDALSEPASVCCVMHANNETGALQPISAVREICRERATPFFTDAVQTVGVLPVRADTADLIAISAHKFYGPKGVGALVVNPRVKLHPILVGGGQERERRAGTENLAGIHGMAAAVSEISPDTAPRLSVVRDRFEELIAPIDGLQVTCHDVPRHPGISHVTIAGISAESALIALDQLGVCASSGAACSSGALERSHVLMAMGFDQERAMSGLRFSFGLSNTVEEAEDAAEVLAGIVGGIRSRA